MIQLIKSNAFPNLFWNTTVMENFSVDEMTFFHTCAFANMTWIKEIFLFFNNFLPDFSITTINCKGLLQQYTKTMANTPNDSLWSGDKKQLIDQFDPYLPLKNYHTQS